MIEMKGADAYFLREESGGRHMHTLKIVVVDPATSHQALTFERVRAGASSAMPMQLPFRVRPVPMPAGLGHPVWIEAPDVDPDYHVRHAVLPAGAGEDALDDLASQVASEPLDTKRPLWQLHFVEGLPGGRVAYVVKVHHAIADGVASAELVARSFQTSGEDMGLTRQTGVCNEAVPSVSKRLAWAIRHDMPRAKQLPGLIARSIRGIQIGRRWQRTATCLPPKPFSGPMTRFNRRLTTDRTYSHVVLKVDSLRAVKSAFGGTLNDVYVTIVGGALRRYLDLHGELPTEPLSAAVPVSVRGPGDDPTFGNAVASWYATTGSHVENPVERLRVVADSTRAASELFAARDARLPIDWLEHWHIRRAYLQGIQGLAAAVTGRPSFNVIVSNVRGPSRQLYSGGARVVGLHSMGPLALQQGINFTAWSYLDDFAIGVQACREHVPDLKALTACLAPELEELTRAAAYLDAGAA